MRPVAKDEHLHSKSQSIEQKRQGDNRLPQQAHLQPSGRWEQGENSQTRSRPPNSERRIFTPPLKPAPWLANDWVNPSKSVGLEVDVNRMQIVVIAAGLQASMPMFSQNISRDRLAINRNKCFSAAIRDREHWICFPGTLPVCHDPRLLLGCQQPCMVASLQSMHQTRSRCPA